MRKVFNISLYTTIFLLVAAICVLSIKKFFYKKMSDELKSIVATNYVTELVSFNEIVAYVEEVEDVIAESAISVEEELIEVVEENDVMVEISEENKEVIEENIPVIEEVLPSVDSNMLYDGLSESDLVLKLEKNLKNELSGTGINFVEYYKTTGLDPYLAVAIVLHETGCTWNCSNLVKQCYNYGGMKGGEVKYNNTRYTCYSSKEEGINAYLNMLYNNYYAKGLTTAELINPKYAASLEWSVKINNYIDKIKNS